MLMDFQAIDICDNICCLIHIFKPAVSLLTVSHFPIIKKPVVAIGFSVSHLIIVRAVGKGGRVAGQGYLLRLEEHSLDINQVISFLEKPCYS